MARSDVNIIKSASEYTRSYEGMRGMSLGTSSLDTQKRYGYLENMYVDYEGGGEAVESIPGFRRLASLGGRIHGIYSQKLGEGAEFIIVHAGGALYRFNKDERDALSEKTLTLISEIADSDSHAFAFGREVCIMDGETLIRIDEDGIASRLGSTGAMPHVPTTYINGAASEPRNLLTDEFIETFSLSSTDPLTYGSKHITYEILDSKEKTCAVTGTATTLSGELHIPSYVDIGGERYAVVKIAEWAFRFQTEITALITNPSLTEIERYAFWGCSSLSSVILSSTVRTVGEYAFHACSSMSYLYFGRSLSRIDPAAFYGCTALTSVSYGGDANTYAAIDGKEELDGRTVSYYSVYRKVRLAIQLHSKSPKISSVTVGGTEKEFSFDEDFSEIILDYEDKSLAEGKTVVVRGSFGKEDAQGFLSLGLAKSITPSKAVLGCKRSAVFDGRIFLSAHPSLGGAVFYSSDDTPLYFPVSNYFVDGAGGYPVTALLSAHGSLAVFKSGDGGSGSIFYHTRSQSPSGAVSYPVSYTHGGISACGAAYSFFDDAVFLTPLGVCALEPVSGSDYREIKSRSGNISPLLARESLSDIKATVWRGYLVLMAGGHFYLGDSRDRFTRDGSFEYEWYYLDGIGSYKNDSRVYRYASSSKEGYLISDTPDAKVTETVMSVADGSGELIYYVTREDGSYAVYPTEEFEGGDFSPATAVLGGELLFFGTESGDLCLFNSDKRGVAPDRIKESPDFDPEAYGRTMGSRIHPEFYGFEGHAPRYALKTKSDSCDIPYLTKSTVRGSLVIKCKAYARSRIICEVGTDKDGFSAPLCFPGEYFGFGELDFATLSTSVGDYCIVPVAEAKRGWIEKEISLYSQDFCSPIGVYSINYRYKIKGRIK